mmetsp:Transcript_93935/g.223510  ORF Transcript_93935/g.223510 Transcript_93935/m.223510 type:complete len:1346 (-) Transcript_93935:101-4138(-)
MSWDNYRGGAQDNRWGQESWQDSGTGWGQDSWQEDSRGSGWQASRHEEPLDPWASYLANKNKGEEAAPWSSQGNHRGGHRQDDHHGSNDRGGRQDSWGGSRGRRSPDEDDSWNNRQQEDSWKHRQQDDSWNHRQQDNSWNQRQRQDDHSRQSWGQDSWQQSNKWDGDSQDNHGGGRSQASHSGWHSRNSHQEEDLWAANWGEDKRRSGRQQEDRGGWSDWERPQRNQDSGNHDSWSRDNRHDDQQAWGQNSWDQDASDPWANWNSSRGGQDHSSGWGAASGQKDKDWDGVNQWATQLLEQGDVDWGTRPEIAITKDFYEEMGDEKARTRTKPEIEELRVESGIAIMEGECEECPVPGPFSSFDEVRWPAELQQSLIHEFETPTPIQKQIWPLALQGRDVVGIAETGSGKTVSYVLPMIIHISRQEELEAGDGPVGLVLAPTRELAKQIERVCKKYGSMKRLASATIVGGMKTSEHKELLQARNDIIVATPGRFLQALGDEWTKLNRCTFVVLDEADELLEHKGFGSDIRAIMTQVRKERQVLMFSATWPEAVKELAQEICTASDGRPPVHIHIGGTRLAACKSIVQRAEIVDDDEAKFTKLKEKLHEMAIFQEGSTDKCIIFCRSRNGVIKLKDMLTNEDMVWRGDSGCLVKELHGELQQADRDWAMEEFRDGALPCVVATGVLARGHDIPQVRFVINYDMPRVAEDYIHRVGRTGRAGHTGYAFTFVNRSNWQELQWGHDYLLGVLQATEQNVDETLQEAIDAHLKAAEWKEDAWWEDAANWNSGSGYPVGEVVDVEFVEDDNVVLTENICALARKLVGEYVEHDVNHGKTVYKRTASSNIEEMFLYYFDDGEDPQSMGWYFGTAIGGDDVFGWSESMETGWHVPHHNPDALAGLKVKRRQAAAWNTSDQQAIAQTSTEEYYEAGHGASAADFVQEVSGQTSTEAYLAQTGVTDPKEPSTLNSSAQEFTPQEYQNQAEWYSGQDGCFQGEIPAEMDYSEAAGCGWPQDPAAAAVGYDYEHYAADMSQAFYDQNAYCDQTAAMFEAAYDQSAYYDPAASTFEAADMSAFASSTQRPPPGLEEENAIPASGCEVEAEPFVLAHDEVAMQVQPEALNGKEAEEAAETSPDQDCTRTGLVDMEAEEPVDDTELVNAKPEEELPVEAELQQVPQVPQEVNTSVADTEAEVAQPQAEQMPAQDQPAEQPVEVQPAESTPKAAELISEAEAEKPLDPEPAAEKAPADQASSKEGWSTFWDDGTGQDQEAKVEAVPDNCEVYNIDKNPESVEAPSADAASGLSITSEADCKKAEDKPKDKHIEANPIAEEPAEPADTSTTDANAEGMAAETA